MRNVERAKQIAKSKGVSFAFVCTQIGKSRGYLAEILANNRDIPEKMLEPVAQALGVPVSELTGEEQKEKPAPGGSELDARFDELLSQMTDADRADLLEYMEFKVAKRKENPNG